MPVSVAKLTRHDSLGILMLSQKSRLLDIIFARAFRHSPTPAFPLSSGILSKYYIDCKRALSWPEARILVGDLMIHECICIDNVVAVGGLALGAVPIAIAVSDAAFRKGVSISSFVIRKEPKPHGLRRHIEGEVNKGDRVVIVDDVITTGRSTIDAIIKSRDEGLEVVKAVALVDRQEENGKENIEDYGVPFEALFTLEDLTALLNQS